ncbi:MAG: hypothetical protein K8S22_18125, partial [Betaproteobacteria bacterium]|nr:hypothetical protein [Betaproteobacteria bacterium]
MTLSLSGCRSALRKFGVLTALLAMSLPFAPALAQNMCPTPPVKPLLEKDFSPNAPVVPKPTGDTYQLPDVLRDDFLVAWWLQGFYNGLITFPRKATTGINIMGGIPVMTRSFDEADSIIFSKYFVDTIRSQEDIKNEVTAMQQQLQIYATAMNRELTCGQSGKFNYRRQKGVMGNEDSYSVHVAVGSFSVFSEATCEIGPKQCCGKNDACPSGYDNNSAYTCNVKWTIYDNYNFSWKTGTGGTGFLKRINPLGWGGTSFHQFGYWNEKVSGSRYMCLLPEEVAEQCCKPQTAVQPPPPPPPPPPKPKPVVDPPPTAQPCPECDAIARDIDLTRKGIAIENAQIAESQRLLADNAKKQQELAAKIRELQNEMEKGQWTASGTDTQTGITKSYDAAKGDGEVHVTARDAAGKIIDSYTYARSKNTEEIRHKIETFEKMLQALRDDVDYINKLIGAAQARKARLEADLKRLEAELAECLKRCRGIVPPPPPPPPPPVNRVGTDVPIVPRGAAECPQCIELANKIAARQAELNAARAELEKMRKEYTDTVVVYQGQDRRVSNDPEVIKQRIDLVAQTEAMIQRQGDKVRKFEQELEPLQRSLDACNKSCAPPPPKPIADPPPKPAISTGCNFMPVKPVIIGPKATYGMTDDLIRSVAGAAFPSMGGSSGGGMFGGGSMMGGGMFGGGGSALPSGGGDNKPKLATDPVRNKQTFTEPTTGTVIQVGSQYRPDGKLLVSIGVDKAADKGIIHQAALERVQYLPDGECGKQA